jgi:hypothetical protein
MENIARRGTQGAGTDPAREDARLNPIEEIRGHGKIGNEAQLLEDGPDAGSPGIPGRAQMKWPAEERHGPVVGLDGAGQDLHQRALPGAILTDEPVDQSPVAGEARAPQRLNASE